MADLRPPILRLPAELVQHIAGILPDADLCAFTLSCRLFAALVLPSHSSVWRRKFEDQYDSIWVHTSEELKIEYQTRALVLPQKVSFRLGETEKEYLWLEVLQTLLLEAYLYTKNGAFHDPSKNLMRITEVTRNSDFLQRPITGHGKQTTSKPSDLFCVIQLCLTHLSLNLETPSPCSRKDYNIERVYSYGRLYRVPLVVSGKVDVETLLHIRNFWQRHLTSSREDTFLKSYRTVSERPDTWTCPFEQGDDLKTSWMGYYSCLHPYPKTAKELKHRQTCANLGPHWDETCATALLNLSIDNDPQNWPDLFNAVIPMSEHSPSRRFFCGTQSYYSTMESPTYLVRGFFEPIPCPQGEMPGWSRICFVIYEADRESLTVFDQEDHPQNESFTFPEESWPPVALDTDFHWIYGSEGIILPGGKIMLGQWFNMTGEGLEKCERGPFIYWDA